MSSPDPKCIRRGGMAAVVAAAVAAAALAVASAAPRSAVAQSAAAQSEIPSASASSVLDPVMPSHQHVGLRGHGFVGNNGNFTTIDAPRAGAYTVVFGINDNGKAVGGYADRRGTAHGFLLDQGKFTAIDFPGAKGTF